MEVSVDEVHRVIQGSFLPYVGLTQALIPALAPDTHFIKLNGLLSFQAIPNLSAVGGRNPDIRPGSAPAYPDAARFRRARDSMATVRYDRFSLQWLRRRK